MDMSDSFGMGQGRRNRNMSAGARTEVPTVPILQFSHVSVLRFDGKNLHRLTTARSGVLQFRNTGFFGTPLRAYNTSFVHVNHEHYHLRTGTDDAPCEIRDILLVFRHLHANERFNLQLYQGVGPGETDLRVFSDGH